MGIEYQPIQHGHENTDKTPPCIYSSLRGRMDKVSWNRNEDEYKGLEPMTNMNSINYTTWMKK